MKKKKGLFDQKVNFIYDPKLDNVEPGPRVLKKLEEAKKKGLFDLKVNFIVDDSLERVKSGPFELKKLEEANFHLSKLKSLP